MGLMDFIDSLAFGLFIAGIVVASFIIPVIIAYAVFSVVSSQSINVIVRGAVFALYTIGVFLIGVYAIGSAYEDSRKDVRKLIGECEKKVASISSDVRFCGSDVRNSVESKAYDVLSCLKAIEKKI
jgi:hypothetical protein